MGAVVSDVLGFSRFLLGLRSFLGTTIPPDEAKRLVREWMRDRDQRFLNNLARSVFGYAASPYLKLFRNAGCTHGDVEKLVRQDGLESALLQLISVGVYISWDEFKGHNPAVRGSQTFQFSESDFDNPLVRLIYETTSGGSSGVPVRMRIDLESHTQSAPDWSVWFDAHNWMSREMVFWTPTHTGMANRYLRCAKFGMRYSKWFAMVDMVSPADRLRSGLIHRSVRLVGGFPRWEATSIRDTDRVADYLITASRRTQLLVNTSPSAAAGISQVVRDRGETLSGVAFLLGAEPVTVARSEAIEACGAQAVPNYGTSESGWVGGQFPGRTERDEVHIFQDAYAVVPRSMGAAEAGQPAAMLLTGLRPASPKVLLNADIGDSGVFQETRSGFAYEQYGYNLRIHTIRSYRKITAWGVTFAVRDLYPILEESLPQQCGGKIGNYQLLEEQGTDGRSALRILVSPQVTPFNERRVREVFLERLGRLHGYYQFMTKVLADADALQVESREPIATSRGKVFSVLPQRMN